MGRYKNLDLGMDRLAQLFLQHLVHQRCSAGSAHKHHAVDLLGGQIGVRERLVHAYQCLIQKRFDQRFVVLA